MTQRTSGSNTKLDKAMNPEQFEQVVEAILAGKYSWACVLILRFAGYNPLHYIPYRTYNRLTKENCQIGIPGRHQTTSMNTASKDATTKPSVLSSQNSLSKINDLSYLEVLEKQNSQVRGGNSEGLFCSQNDTFHFVPDNISWFIQPESEYEITAKAPGPEEIYLPYGAASKVFQSESFKIELLQSSI